MDKRANPPAINSLIKPNIPKVYDHVLNNGLVMHELRAGSQPILKVEIMFRAGRPFETKRQVGRFTNHLMREGTTKMTTAQIAEKIDFYGSSLVISESMDHGGFSLFCLKKHLPRVLPLLMDTLMDPAFSEQELERFKRNAIEKLHHDISKNDFIAFREITSLLFGDDNMYGYNSSIETIQAVTSEDLSMHYQRCYNAGNAVVFISGKVDDKALKLIDEAFSQLNSGIYLNADYRIETTLPLQRVNMESKNKHQIAIRLGKRAVTRSHPDFYGLYVLNTILGGYFGSRLMTNIREDKGFTYNIYSSMDTMLYDASLIIALETDPKHLENSFTEIYRELNLLSQEKVNEEELQMVKNYLLGYLLTALDGPLNASELIKSFLLEGLQMEDFEHLLNSIIEIDSKKILELSQRYLDPSSFTELVVGS